ncbi:MAG: polyribonucleotide nucleotidyltransferase [Puniceicoccales bacterium]|jgi:polyribonucleotide nucleotidyltransferase|nr:polyribonucleotide nucleotidyltransferase [Puniceicoccales bacterium]
MLKQKYFCKVDGLDLTFSTGSIAKLTNGAVTVQSGQTVVFVSATMAPEVNENQTFFPLIVDYREKFSAAGRFPGGYVKREGKPTEKEILTSRLCDRPLRPLFPKDFLNEVQIIGLLLAADLNNEPDILMVNGASAALMCSNVPWNGPIACVRIGQINGQFVVNPTNDQQFESDLDLIYVGNKEDALMIEGCADQLPEDRFIEALHFAHAAIQPILTAQEALARQCNPSKLSYEPRGVSDHIVNFCEKALGERLKNVWYKASRQHVQTEIKQLKKELVESAVEGQLFADKNLAKGEIDTAFEKLQEKLCRTAILDESLRLDHRQAEELREISCEVDVLPKIVHGSAIFERGETQALVSATLGSGRDAQDLDGLTGGAQSKSFILHYNFPPYSVGEVGRFGFTNRREIGHGALAERSLLPIIPSESEFPYSIRLVSDIMGSNGSTSMASVCGGTLALMDAGVPILAPVAGISVGLVTQYNANHKIERYRLITDILGEEDHFGDMDFKICGTETGITGFQLDLKIAGLPLNIMAEAIHQNRRARMQILATMRATLPQSRSKISQYAPHFQDIRINPEKIGALIGPGGKNIKRLTETMGCQIDICEDNSGAVRIYAKSEVSLKQVVDEISSLDKKIEVGKTYQGIVRTIKDFGVFVECLPGQEGMVHVSELSDCKVRHPSDVCSVGDTMVVVCLGVDERGKVRLSKKAASIHL